MKQKLMMRTGKRELSVTISSVGLAVVLVTILETVQATTARQLYGGGRGG